ncbi:hypothetical protein CC85DRAFT_289258 [Cutaneotrichosporon oleaginosum]|uniref:Uncharacterized protein n=1 Tax=Cutaneotrichosporon oleaginosum TaxID=879819 RepID=A0A0J0XCA5_9TREE|nr:uncharacterized protein CC85DRAFT_289258 [Cutaneotrichosporon oleaginosum]KLT38713.1 hypothetical protein CC85DRAFT_289258 [Cutaneotrichosporon oleaginosum]TXT15456.1 hypothetical protein COLE_01649 [Cutaneotrichosporon oleaginosum]
MINITGVLKKGAQPLPSPPLDDPHIETVPTPLAPPATAHALAMPPTPPPSSSSSTPPPTPPLQSALPRSIIAKPKGPWSNNRHAASLDDLLIPKKKKKKESVSFSPFVLFRVIERLPEWASSDDASKEHVGDNGRIDLHPLNYHAWPPSHIDVCKDPKFAHRRKEASDRRDEVRRLRDFKRAGLLKNAHYRGCKETRLNTRKNAIVTSIMVAFPGAEAYKHPHGFSDIFWADPDHDSLNWYHNHNDDGDAPTPRFYPVEDFFAASPRYLELAANANLVPFAPPPMSSSDDTDESEVEDFDAVLDALLQATTHPGASEHDYEPAPQSTSEVAEERSLFKTGKNSALTVANNSTSDEQPGKEAKLNRKATIFHRSKTRTQRLKRVIMARNVAPKLSGSSSSPVSPGPSRLSSSAITRPLSTASLVDSASASPDPTILASPSPLSPASPLLFSAPPPSPVEYSMDPPLLPASEPSWSTSA